MNTANCLIHELTGEIIPLDDFLPLALQQQKRKEQEERQTSSPDWKSIASVAQTTEGSRLGTTDTTTFQSSHEGQAEVETVCLGLFV